jgi:hypothetical protein
LYVSTVSHPIPPCLSILCSLILFRFQGFGKDIVKAFLDKFDFDLVARAHMVVESGKLPSKSVKMVNLRNALKAMSFSRIGSS